MMAPKSRSMMAIADRENQTIKSADRSQKELNADS
jgi:hypothetical protein